MRPIPISGRCTIQAAAITSNVSGTATTSAIKRAPIPTRSSSSGMTPTNTESGLDISQKPSSISTKPTARSTQVRTDSSCAFSWNIVFAATTPGSASAIV